MSTLPSFRRLFDPFCFSTAQDLLPHPPPDRHQFVDRDLDDELLERDLDRELYIRALADDDLFVRFYDDLD